MRWRLSSAVRASLLVSIGIAAGVWHLWFSPHLDDRREQTAVLAQTRAAVARAEEGVRSQEDLAGQVTLLEQAQAASLPVDSAASVTALITIVTEAATTAGAHVTRVTPRAAVEEPHLTVVPVEVVLEGTYQALVKTIAMVEAGAVVVTRVRVAAAEGPGAADGVRVATFTAVALAATGGGA